MRWLPAAAAMALALALAPAASAVPPRDQSAPAVRSIDFEALPSDLDEDDPYDLLTEILRKMIERGGFGHIDE